MIIGICNQKGGVGKTTLTFNLSYLLAEAKKKVLVIDADPQISLTTIFNQDYTEHNLYNVLLDNQPIKDNIIEIEPNLHLLQGSDDMVNFDLNILSMKGRESILSNALHSIKDEYDYILIDSPPTLGLLLINILVASNKLIIPVGADYLSYKGLHLLISTIEKVKVSMNKQLSVLGCVLTNYTNTLHAKEIEELLDIPILSIIGSSVKVKDSCVAGVPLHRFDSKHKINNQFKQLVERITE